MELQETFRNFTEDELISGATTIYNHAYNPSTAPGTGTTEELNYINEQTAQKAKRGKLDAYAYLWDLISTDVTTEFINKFAALFLKVVEPELPLWYVTTIKEDNR